MRADPDIPFDELPTRVRRRLAVDSLLRSLAVSAAIVVGYFVLPMTNLDTSGVVLLFVGLAVMSGVLAWQIRAIATSPYPRVRAVGALTTSVPLFFVVFATTYFLLERNDPGAFTEPMTRLDAVYFTITTFATVGYGDIAAVSETARALATVQMLGDLAIVGFVARAFVNALQTGLERRSSGRGR